MAWPDFIEVVPLASPVHAEVSVPGSKSITNRALILAALAPGCTTLKGALWSEDTQVMVEGLRHLGFEISVESDPSESCNRVLTVRGWGGRVPAGGTVSNPVELFAGNAGTAARFLSAFVCLGEGWYRIHGVPRMHQRPQGALFAALRELGYLIEAPGDRLPALIRGGGPREGTCRVSLAESSQFASALLLSAGVGRWRVAVEGDNEEESSYVEMTRQLTRVFPSSGGVFQIEPDASSGSYFWGANLVQQSTFGVVDAVKVAHWPVSGWQIDAAFPKWLDLPARVSRRTDLGDSIMTAIVLSALGSRPVSFTDLGRLRVQECERVVALRTELTKCGVEVREHGDTLEVRPRKDMMRGAEIETYGDHRVAMCFAILGLKVPNMRLKDPACVKKTFPNFFQKLAEAPPHGLGVVLRDAAGRPLSVELMSAE